MDRARALAARLLTGQPEDAALVTATWRQVLAREPKPAELSRAREFLAAQASTAGGRTEALVQLIRALLNLNEFLYVD
jgi:hypothetical protein